MTRSNYGSLRGRRSGNAAWQWVVIGFVLGIGCAVIAGLLLVIGAASGVINADVAGLLSAGRPTNTPIVITATLPPASPTPLPTEVLITPTPSPTVGQVQVVAPTATPTTEVDIIQVEASATPTVTQAAASEPQTVARSGGQVQVPDPLVTLISEMRMVDGGTFDMGTTIQEVRNAVDECTNVYEGSCDIRWGEDSAPPHKVTLDSFMMDVTEVTYNQYLAFLNWKRTTEGANWTHRTGCEGQPCIATRAEDPNSNIIFDTANYRVLPVINEFPMVSVTWYGAKAYCEAIGRRLPTEAEWERAARASDGRIYPWGNTFDTNLAKTSRPKPEDPTQAGAVAVGSYAAGASPYGMLDMAGNAAEWVSDWYSPTYYIQQAQSSAAVINPQGPPAGTEKVVRGGSWDSVPFFARSVHRQSADPVSETLWIGFRCAADAQPGGASIIDTTGGATGNTTDGQAETTPLPSGAEEEAFNSQPTLQPPPPTAGGQEQPLPTLNPGG